jgi:hypothetical protein
MENLFQSRRTFLKVAGITAASALVAGTTGCSKTAGNDSAAAIEQITWDETHDIIVVGAGLAGVASSLTVALEGKGATCLLLEKGQNSEGNGNTPYSAGSILWTNQRDNFLAYLKELRATMGNTPDDVLEAFADGISENLDWLKNLSVWADGAEEDATITGYFTPGSGKTCYPEYPELPHAYSLGNIIWNSKNADGITHVCKFLHAELEKHSDLITEKTNTPVKALVQDPENKTILGVVYDESGKSVYSKAAKGVILCLGGFENNPTMRADYLSGATARPIAGRQNTGDGIPMVLKCGADLWHMNSCAGFWTSASPINGSSVTMRTDKQYGITVGVNGRRFFMDWDSDHEHDWSGINAGLYTLANDTGDRHGHMQFGGEWPHLPMPETQWFILDSDGFEKMQAGDRSLQDPIANGVGYVADTIDLIAEKTQLPEDALSKTISEWNECCTKNDDVYFHRPASTLNPIKNPPFYAIHCSAALLNTDGGARRSAKGEILDLDGQPIPNLYSAGEFGSIWCNMYNGGGNLGECLAFGRISVRNCLGIA